MAGQAGVRPSSPAGREGGRARRGRVRSRRRLRAGKLATTSASSRRATASAGWLDRPPGHRAHRDRRRASGLHFDEGLYVNVGPWRIPYTHTGVLNYCKELGVPLQIFVNEAESSYFYLRRQHGRPAGRQACAAARSQGRHDRLHQRAARQGDRSAPARSAADRRGQAAVRRFLVSQGYSIRPTTRTRRSRPVAAAIRTISRRSLQSGFANRMRSIPATSGTRRRRCSSRSAAWTSSRRVSSARSETTASRSMRGAVRPPERHGREGRVPRHEERQEDRSQRRLRRRLHAAVGAGRRRHQSVARDDGGGQGHHLQQQREDGAGDEAAVLGGGRPDLRRPPLFESAARRVLVSVERLFLQKGVLLGLYANGPVGDLLDSRSRRASSTC